MRVVISTVGRFHLFALARELEKRSLLTSIFSGFPWSALAREGVSRNLVKTFPYVRPFLMAFTILPIPAPEFLIRFLHMLSALTLDFYVSRRLPSCDIFVGHHGSGLWTGRVAKSRGAKYICDVGATHILWRERILKKEYSLLGIRRSEPSKIMIFRELQEYDEADLITVPSNFVLESFVEEGIDRKKLAVIPYGARTTHFFPSITPNPNTYDLLFVGRFSVRKGGLTLIEAFERLNVPEKYLTIVGTIDKDIKTLLGDRLNSPYISLLGHLTGQALRDVMSRSHILVLPSIEEGLALVTVEAMACGCPIIVSANTGVTDIIKDGVQGFVVPPRDTTALVDAMRKASGPDIRLAMSLAAIETVRNIGGWSSYGDAIVEQFNTLTNTAR